MIPSEASLTIQDGGHDRPLAFNFDWNLPMVQPSTVDHERARECIEDELQYWNQELERHRQTSRPMDKYLIQYQNNNINELQNNLHSINNFRRTYIFLPSSVLSYCSEPHVQFLALQSTKQSDKIIIHRIFRTCLSIIRDSKGSEIW